MKVILECAPSIVPVEPKQEPRRGLVPRLLVCSAHSKTALDARMDAIRSYLTLRPQALADVAYTLGVRRDHLSHRSFTIANSDGELFGGEVHSHHISDTSPPLSLVFAFSGQGTQWARMGVELIRTFPSFQRDIQLMDQILQQLQSPPAWSIEGMVVAYAHLLLYFHQNIWSQNDPCRGEVTYDIRSAGSRCLSLSNKGTEYMSVLAVHSECQGPDTARADWLLPDNPGCCAKR